MHIHQIVIDGFKSYATRTVVPDFDLQFNAITGLNGSGKSNILDSICFVLGISNLTQVRASNLQDLVYKQGQAGVSKASVSIVFNNKDKTCSPIGYEDCDEITVTRQVIIGGKNKYLINGHNAQLNRVQNLFHSVQLNVNNPHFLIMQGRITKVLNMKPPEILAMVEEAAGTKMYQKKKDSSLQLIEKKQQKVDEIDRVLAEDITPALDKLRKEKASYMQWAAANTECERLSRFCTAYRYTVLQDQSSAGREKIDGLKDKLSGMKDQIQQAEKDVALKSERVQELMKQKESEMTDAFKELEAEVSTRSKLSIKQKTMIGHKHGSIQADEKKLAEAGDTLKQLGETEKALLAQQASASAELERMRGEAAKAQEEAEKVHKQYVAAQGGMAAEGDKSLAERLAELKSEKETKKTDAANCKRKSEHYAAELKKKKADAKKSETEYAKCTAAYTAGQAELAKLVQQLEKTGFSPEAEQELRSKMKEKEARVAELKEKADCLQAQLSSLDFRFSDPERGFDRSKVKGLVAKLVHVKQQAATTALEVAAGNKLYQVVVDSEVTGKLLLEKGKLQRRVTIIPLNKVNPRTLPAERAAAAKKEAGADLALSLVGYDDELDAAMKYVFGTTLVCKDMAAARSCAFDKKVSARSVTLDGDVLDPAGTLTGGARKQGSLVLQRLAELNKVNDELEREQGELTAMRAEAKRMAAAATEWKKLKQSHDLLEHDLAMKKQVTDNSELGKLFTTIEKLETDLKDAKQVVETADSEISALEADCKRVEKDMADFEKDAKSKTASLQKKAKDAKQHATKVGDSLRALEQSGQQAEMDLKEARDEAKAVAAGQAVLGESIASAKAELAKQEAEFAQHEAETDKFRAQLDEHKERMRATDKEVARLTKDVGELGALQANLNRDSKLVAAELNELQSDASDSIKELEVLEEDQPWVLTEKHLFGRANSDYDFKAKNPKAAAKQLAAAQEQQKTQSQKINKKVMSMFEKAEQEYQELVNKKRIIANDKLKIEKVIGELDEKKNEVLQTTWQKVNGDFGSIFSTLLPGTTAKLEPPEGCTVEDGLEVKVAFGGVWKESLSELSGGQRSLVALSLVLALLLFKPAPMYILDEIDAALDLSHTQNIGQMIKSHFKQSQFIVVSLKEGMFNNANVLYRTKFVDGVSTVTRTIPNGASR